MFDVFYLGEKPNLFEFERPAVSLADAASRSKTRYYWFIYSNHDLQKIDFDWQPLPWENTHVHVWTDQWNQYGGVYFADKYTVHEYKWQFHDKIIPSLSTDNKWTVLHPIVKNSFDFSWVPHPMDPPFIYVWGNNYWPAEKMPTIEYHVDGATERKYMESTARLAPNKTNWTVSDNIDADSVDYSWVPDPQDPPYIYEFATQWQPNGGAVYTVPGATERKYVDQAHRRLPDKSNWEKLAVLQSFDYSWHPDNTEEPFIYVFGNQHWSGTIMPTLKYHVTGATQEKFVDSPIAKLGASMANWRMFEDIDDSEWDWTWVPNPKDPPYIYAFGNQWNPPEYKVSVQYEVEGATEVKYMEQRTRRLPHPELFRHNIAVAEFDYSWEPNPFDPPFTYVFGNQWNPAVLEPTVVYNVAGATEIKYIDDLVARVAQDLTNWEILDEIQEFDYSWRPNPTDPPYIYIFGNQWLTPEQRPAVRYRVPTGTQLKYMDEPKARRVGNPELFVTNADCEFDYSWETDPGSPPYNYVFGNQWWPAEIMPTVEYRMAGATEIKYMSEPVAKLNTTVYNWVRGNFEFEFDTSWCPDPGSPPYIYVFGNQWYSAEVMSTIEYHVTGATERKYMDQPKAKLLPMMDRWAVPEEVDASNIDFSWHPHPNDEPYIHHFGTEHQMSIGLTYTVTDATELKFEGEIPRIVKERKAVEVVDIFFVDRSNSAAGVRFDRLRERYPNIQKVRYANSMMATIQRCVTRAKTTKFWVISSEYDYKNFDFTWHAQPWQNYMTHVFPSQHTKWSDTFLINRWEFERHSKWADGLEQFPNLNFVTNQTVTKVENLNNIYYVDHGNPESDRQFTMLQKEFSEITRTRFVDNYLDVLRRIMSTADTESVWVISSLCNYDFFDFTWKPEPWQAEMIHCFTQNVQKRGDTFYIHVESFRKQMVDLELLDWFNVINYCDDLKVERFTMPVHVYEGDNLIEEIKNYEFTTPYVFFTNQPDITVIESPCLWTKKDRTVKRITKSGASALVPRDIKADLRTQIYDYPFLEKRDRLIADYYYPKTTTGLDIVYISNGEPDEERWYEHLCYQSNTADIEWVRGVNGRTAAYQEAARRSRTPWFFAVFAKLEVAGGEFPWFDWQPDYWQGPKHYIFNARNPLNGLEYGHQGIIAYNKSLVLSNNTPGIDFTLSQPHESVPILSGTAHFNQNPWMTWRTAFREVVKLTHFNATEPTLETESRLHTWLTKAEGNYADMCLAGARDAVEFFDSVGGDYETLKLSFEWAWLQAYYDDKY